MTKEKLLKKINDNVEEIQDRLLDISNLVVDAVMDNDDYELEPMVEAFVDRVTEAITEGDECSINAINSYIRENL
jgi:nucleoid DNA-binding protein